MNITVLAAGAWGTALAIAFSARHNVTLWARETDLIADMQNSRENRRFLPGFPFPPTLAVEGSFSKALQNAELILVATPIAGLRPTLKTLEKQGSTVPFLWVCKGFEANSGNLPHQIASNEHPAPPHGLLAGPSFAQEVAGDMPTAMILASPNNGFAHEIARKLHGGHLRIYVSDDLTGAEVGGAVKNILAIATGVCDGLNLGANARSALITRGLAEVARLGVALGAKKETFMGLAGMGDLILTCTGNLSRNRRIGLELAKGKSLKQSLDELGHVAEGVLTAFEAMRIAQKLNIEMPITAAVVATLEGRLSPKDAVEELLSRDQKDEMA